jgi:putative acetyltransferase
MNIRWEEPEDAAAIRQVVAAAFGQVAEADLVDKLRARGKCVLSLVAEADGQIVGHILFSEVTLATNPGARKLVGLGPLAVVPARQRGEIGSRLVRAGLFYCEIFGYDAAVVLGHPEYYPRFGFVPASRFGIHSEYNVPDEVFMALELTEGALADCAGPVSYQPEFNEV